MSIECRNVPSRQALILRTKINKIILSRMSQCPMSQSAIANPSFFTPCQKESKSRSPQMSPLSHVPIRNHPNHSLLFAKRHPNHNHHKCPDRPNIIYPPIPLNGKAFQHFPIRGILNNNATDKIGNIHNLEYPLKFSTLRPLSGRMSGNNIRCQQ